MALGLKVHWIGAFFFFTASILLLISTLSAPIVSHIGLLKVHLNNGTQAHHKSTISFGTLGYCVLRAGPLDNAHDYCSHRHIGYTPSAVIAAADHTQLSEIASGTSDSFTRVMILHPIACGVVFLAWLTSLGAGVLGSLVSVVIGCLAGVLLLVVLATDFSLFGILRHHVNGDKSGSRAEFGEAIWCEVAAFVCLCVAIILVTATCFSARREKKRATGMVG